MNFSNNNRMDRNRMDEEQMARIRPEEMLRPSVSIPLVNNAGSELVTRTSDFSLNNVSFGAVSDGLNSITARRYVDTAMSRSTNITFDNGNKIQINENLDLVINSPSGTTSFNLLKLLERIDILETKVDALMEQRQRKIGNMVLRSKSEL